MKKDRISKQRYNVLDALDLVTGSDSDLSELSDDEGAVEDVLPVDESLAEEADLHLESDDESADASCPAKQTTHISLEKK